VENGVLQGSVLRVPCAVTVSDVTSVMGHCMHRSLRTDTFVIYCQSHVRMVLNVYTANCVRTLPLFARGAHLQPSADTVASNSHLATFLSQAIYPNIHSNQV